MKINKKILVLGIFLIGIFIGSLIPSQATEIVGGNLGWVVHFATSLPSYIRSALAVNPLVVSVTDSNGETEIILNYSVNPNGDLRKYLDGLERNVQENKDRLTIYPDNQPAPLCLRDAVSAVKVGYYDVGVRTFTVTNSSGATVGSFSARLPFAVFNDSRCP